MPCEVYIYNNAFVAVASPAVEIVAKDYSRRMNLCPVQNNRLVSGALYGANLGFATGSFSYMVFVDDTGGTYGPASIFPLNGDEPGRLDVVLYPVAAPGSGTGVGPTTFLEISRYISMQFWSDEEKIGVRMLVNALYVSRSGWDPTLSYMVRRWERQLEGLGINPNIV